MNKLGMWMGVIVPVMLTACAGRPLQRIDTFFSGEDPVSVREVWRHTQCGTDATETKLTLFADRDDLLRWAAERRLPLVWSAGGLPGGGAYVLVDLGQRPAAGHAVAISAAAGQCAGTLMLRGTFFAPSDPDAVAQPESPCVLVNLPPDRFDAVRLYDQNGELRATALQITPVP